METDTEVPLAEVALQSTRSTSNPLKRKEPDTDVRAETTSPPTGDAPSQQGEYQNGRVICEVCGVGISFRDESTDRFTVEHWNSHRLTCTGSGPPPSKSPDSADNSISALTLPLAKRRRAKRTEEERIEYLRTDPHVAKFEAYRVLCASCNKWIRLRPNSTYCSIPWDAHRKSCLARQINNKNIYALEERNNFLSRDPYVRKYDAVRVLCSICDVWLSLNPDDHLQAMQTWNDHRASCHKASSTTPFSSRDRGAVPTEKSLASSSGNPSRDVPATPEPPTLMKQSQESHPTSPTFYALSPVDYSPVNDSRRRNAEHRAEALRADPLIGKVEPNRVFCTMCQKWVQLRQDSSYCAYPWLQHRGKCMARQQRRSEKAAEIAQRKAKKYSRQNDEEHISDGCRGSERPESEKGMDSRTEELRHHHHHTIRSKRMPNMESHREIQTMGAQWSIYSLASCKAGDKYNASPSNSVRHVYSRHGGRRPVFGSSGAVRMHDQGFDMDQELEHSDSDSSSSKLIATGQVSHQLPVIRVTDLDSALERKRFILASIEHLFGTTFESTDDLTISTLVGYLNVAIPQDKYEDFGTSEVIKLVAALQEDGYVIFEGDMLRLAESRS